LSSVQATVYVTHQAAASWAKSDVNDCLVYTRATVLPLTGNSRHCILTNVDHLQVDYERSRPRREAYILYGSSFPRSILVTSSGREDIRNKSFVSGVSARMKRGYYEETAVVEFRLYADLTS